MQSFIGGNHGFPSPSHMPITASNSVTSDPSADTGDGIAGLSVGEGRTVSSPGTSAMETPIGPTPPAPVRKTGRFIHRIKLILARLILALPSRKGTKSRRSAQPRPASTI
ncbi:hypothetical protein FIBSPDRAFT_966724 [Athelia psychrophila]|uniref:Uncharacterized protein n=1 Tax=Athelia psychrophila TaxID=1759441 RepID=A0A167WGT3_9AGAM|nr:hypothetical protein FIBSPDRAFT_966724 [Fibularhizoctonia sp. CBS 109695]